MKTRLLAVASALFATWSVAQVPATCDQQRTVDKYQQLRRLTLDLKGRAPTPAEYAALDTKANITQADIRAMLTSDEFRLTMRRVHEDMLWPNISSVSLMDTTNSLSAITLDTGTASTTPDGGTVAYHRQALPLRYRGFADTESAQWGFQCGDFEQTQFDPAFPGEFRPLPAAVKQATMPLSDGGVRMVRQEGWRWVHPYWSADPTFRIRVCAFDAQETLTVGTGASAVTCYGESFNAACGCGPEMKFCWGPRANVLTPVFDSLREQLNRAVDKVSVGGKPYTDLLLSTKADMNGTLAAWKTNIADGYNLSRIVTGKDLNEVPPTLDFTDTNTWVEVDRGGQHAGVMTMPAYLLRFQTNRGRANRFRIDFECDSFVPSSSLETPASSAASGNACSDTASDLTKKCNCRYCHQVLEPLAAHWGTFAEAGTMYLDTTRFPRTNPACVSASPSALCRRFYVTDSTLPSPGSLLPYEYADNAPSAPQVNKDMYTALQGGPRKRAQEIIASGALARCTTRRLFRQLLKRDVRESSDEAALFQTLTQQFTTSNYKLPTLIEAIVSLPEYRRFR